MTESSLNSDLSSDVTQYAGQEVTSPITGRVYEIAFYTLTRDGGTGSRREQETIFWREKPSESEER